ATEGKPFNFSFASNTFTDQDPGSPSLTYTAQLPGAPPQPLPGWLSFNPLTRTFTGTPPNGASDIDVEVIASDGSLTTSDTFRIAITPVDDSPVLVIPIPNQNATEDVLFNFQFNSETFSDPDPGDVLTYSATMADGSPLVTWLQFDAANRRFYGTPTNSDVDTISVKVTAADLNGGPVASDTFDIIIANTDDAPTVATPIGNQTATEDSPFNFTFGAGTFTDQDVGDANNLTYSTSALPTWLSFDPATRTFSGTPSNADVTPIGTPVSITVTATDPSGLSVTDTFTIAVVNTNDAPEVNEPLVDQSATQGQAFSYPFASDTFIDPDGNVLTYSARLSNGDPLPAWLSFDSATRTFSGTPGNEDVQLLPLSIEVTANDGFGGTVTDSFELQVSNTNDAPVVIVVPTDYDALEQVAIDLHGTGIVVADADGDLLTVTLTGQYTNSNLAATAGTTGVIIVSGVNTKTLTLSGTATQFNDLFAGNNGGTLTYWMSGDMPVATDLLTISVSDGTLTSSDTAVINITAVNDGPTNDVPLASQVTNEDTPLVFSAANGNQIQVNDLDAGSAELEVTLSVTNGTLTLAGVGGLVFTAGTGAGDSSLVFRGTQANINAALATLTFNPTTNYSGAALLTITTSDLGNQGVGGTLTDSDNVSIIVNPVNDGPVVASPIPNRVALEDAAFNFQFAVGAFADVDGDLLTYTTNSLPAWLSFDAATRTFSGTPMNSDIGPITINVTATDGDGLSVTDSFIIDVVNVNDAPTVQISLTQYFANEQVPIDLHGTGILVADVDNSLLTVTLNADGNNCTFAATAGSTGVVIVEGMNTNNLILTGTAAQLNDLFAGNNGATLRYLHVDDIVVPTCLVTISASDGTLTGSATTTIYITAVNDAPVNTIPPAQTTDEDTALIFGLANNNQIQINDLDVVGSELEMTLSVTNGTLTLAGVAGLSFSSGDGTADGSMVFRGTQTAINAALATLTFNPNVSYTGAALLTITTSDLGNTGAGGVLTDTDTVNITINATNDAPVIANPIADQYAAEDAAFSFQFAANTFSDADVNDTLIYSAQAGGGGALPAWLSFDPLTRTFSGTPANSDVGTVIVDVIANDNNGGTVTDTFVITVTNTNDAPVVANPIADQMAIQGSPFGFTVPTNAFTDLDGDTLSYSARLSGGAALPAWLVFDAATRTFSGTPANGDVGTLAVEVVVIDGNGGSTSDTFDLVVDDLNDPPVLAIPIANQNALEDTAFSFQFAANTFADPDPGTTLAYSAQLASGGALPAWLIFDAATRTFSGTPANGDVGVLSIRVIASDGIASASADFQLTVAAVNDAPVALGIAPINTQEDAAGSSVDLWTAFSDEDHPSNQLQYSVVNNSNPGLVSSATIDPATGKLHITYAANQFGAGSLVIRAQDPLGANVETTVQINVASVNDVPTTTGIADQQVLASDAPPQINLHSVFSDIENGTGLTYLVTGNTNPMVTPTISIDPVTGVMTVVFAPTVGGQSTITLRATDAEGAWVETQFKVSVTSLIILLPILPEEPVAPVIPPVVTPIEPPVVEPPVIAPPVDSGGGGPIAPDNPADDLGSLLPGVGPGADQEDSSNFVQGGDKSIRDYLRVDEQINSKNATLGSLTTSASLVNMIRPDGGFAPWEQEEFDNEVRRIRTQMDEALEIEYERNAVVAGLTFSITTGLLVWSLRASTLLLTMMSMLPLWRGIDPLPILDEVDKKKKELEQQRKDREREDKSKKEVGYLFDHAHRKEPR
ncbi:MAG TPA: putative Ig domain-containing protein, partial [Cellvibrio sp.]|nr:putative Ig domain-containing protein [Cellvibrio sp.]